MGITKRVTIQQEVIIPNFEEEIRNLVKKMYDQKSEWMSEKFSIDGRKINITVYRDRS